MSSPRRSALRAFAAKVRGFFGAQPQPEFDDELEEHLQLLAERFESRGMSKAEAAAAARRQFGNLTTLREDRRGLQTFLSVEALWRDLCYSLRTLRKSPGFAAVSILTLGLGIGATTTIFSVVNGVLLRPLAYRQPEQLYLVREIIPELSQTYPTLPANLRSFRVWKQEGHSFEDVAIVEPSGMTLTGYGDAEQISGGHASANLFEVLGVRPQLGRSFLPQEDAPGKESGGGS